MHNLSGCCMGLLTKVPLPKPQLAWPGRLSNGSVPAVPHQAHTRSAKPTPQSSSASFQSNLASNSTLMPMPYWASAPSLYIPFLLHLPSHPPTVCLCRHPLSPPSNGAMHPHTWGQTTASATSCGSMRSRGGVEARRLNATLQARPAVQHCVCAHDHRLSSNSTHACIHPNPAGYAPIRFHRTQEVAHTCCAPPSGQASAWAQRPNRSCARR